VRVATRLAVPVWRVGLGGDAAVDVRIADPEFRERGSTARIELPGGRPLALRLPGPGPHNGRNAAAAPGGGPGVGGELGRALAAADVVVVAPIYAAREQPLAGVSAELVARGAARAGATTIAVRERAGVTERVVETVRAGDVVFTLGAGDITRVGPELIERLGTGDEGRGKR